VADLACDRRDRVGERAQLGDVVDVGRCHRNFSIIPGTWHGSW
jgi:hypothetical protein